jgi:hypothetical protein
LIKDSSPILFAKTIAFKNSRVGRDTPNHAGRKSISLRGRKKPLMQLELRTQIWI